MTTGRMTASRWCCPAPGHSRSLSLNYNPQHALQGRRARIRRPRRPSRGTPRALRLGTTPVPTGCLQIGGIHSPQRGAAALKQPGLFPASAFRQALAPGARALTAGGGVEGGRPARRTPEAGASGRRSCGRCDGFGAGQLIAEVGVGPVPGVSGATAHAQLAPWPPPPPPPSISRSCTRSSVASLKIYEECRSGCWGPQGPVRRGREQTGTPPGAVLPDADPGLPASHSGTPSAAVRSRTPRVSCSHLG